MDTIGHAQSAATTSDPAAALVAELRSALATADELGLVSAGIHIDQALQALGVSVDVPDHLWRTPGEAA